MCSWGPIESIGHPLPGGRAEAPTGLKFVLGPEGCPWAFVRPYREEGRVVLGPSPPGFSLGASMLGWVGPLPADPPRGVFWGVVLLLGIRPVAVSHPWVCIQLVSGRPRGSTRYPAHGHYRGSGPPLPKIAWLLPSVGLLRLLL